MDRSILVATDGTAGSDGALRLARSLAVRGCPRVHALTVFEPLALHGIGSPDLVAAVSRRTERSAMDALLDAVRAQLRGLGIDASDWNVRVELGRPAPHIARFAAEHDVGLIVAGLGQHGLPERWLGTETALRVMHLATVPVLAAHPAARELPRRALVATDLSEQGRDASRGALDLLEPGGELHLAHVVHLPADPAEILDPERWRESYLAEVEIRLQEAARELGSTGRASVSWHLLEGSPAHELLRLAERLDPQLIAAGSHGYGALGRLLMGSVSSRLVRAAHCSVLIEPPRLPAAARLVGAAGESDSVSGAPGDVALSNPIGSPPVS